MGVLLLRALLFGVCISAPKLPYLAPGFQPCTRCNSTPFLVVQASLLLSRCGGFLHPGSGRVSGSGVFTGFTRGSCRLIWRSYDWQRGEGVMGTL